MAAGGWEMPVGSLVTCCSLAAAALIKNCSEGFGKCRSCSGKLGQASLECMTLFCFSFFPWRGGGGGGDI